MNKIRITSCALINSTIIGKQLSYVFDILDENNNIIRNGLRKSYTVKKIDEELNNATNNIISILTKTETDKTLDYKVNVYNITWFNNEYSNQIELEYYFDITNDRGNILQNRIKRKTEVKDKDTELQKYINYINVFLNQEENTTIINYID